MAKSISRYEFKLISLFFFAWGVIFLDRLVISYLLPVLAPLMQINNSQTGLVGFATTGTYAISAIIFGAMSDKSGYRKRWLVIFIFITAVASSLCALTQTFTQLLIVHVFVGLGE